MEAEILKRHMALVIFWPEGNEMSCQHSTDEYFFSFLTFLAVRLYIADYRRLLYAQYRDLSLLTMRKAIYNTRGDRL